VHGLGGIDANDGLFGHDRYEAKVQSNEGGQSSEWQAAKFAQRCFFENALWGGEK
jgi:hypothetical protein